MTERLRYKLICLGISAAFLAVCALLGSGLYIKRGIRPAHKLTRKIGCTDGVTLAATPFDDLTHVYRSRLSITTSPSSSSPVCVKPSFRYNRFAASSPST